MVLTAKARCGIQGLIELALQSKDQYIPLKMIAQRCNVSPIYLAHSFAALKRARLVRGIPGVQGGYKLADNPVNITVKQVLEALEGNLSIVAQAKAQDETLFARCVRESLWDKIDERIAHTLESVTLADFIYNSKNIKESRDNY